MSLPLPRPWEHGDPGEEDAEHAHARGLPVWRKEPGADSAAPPRSLSHFFFLVPIQWPLLEVIIVSRARLMLLLHGPLEYVFTGTSGKSSSDSDV